MTPHHPDVLSYLVPRRESFWRWSKGAQSIEWKDGRTIAFREEVLAVLSRLAPARLPPFGAVVLLLAACRDNWNDPDNSRHIVEPYTKSLENAGPMRVSPLGVALGVTVTNIIPSRIREEVRLVLDDLDAMAALSAELRHSTASKCVLAETVFETADRPLSVEAAAAVVQRLSAGFDPEPLFEVSTHDDKYTHLIAELDALRSGLGSIDDDRLRLRLRTGLEQTPSPAQLDLPPAQRVRALISQLRDDPELWGIANLARDLLAAIHVPRALASPEDLPVGGVSDLSNRGPLDRLLVSELAHDDHTLTTRIALGEALYLRREAPSSQPPRGRAILIDTGIRMWGVPRVFATAVSLALAASADTKAPVWSFHPNGARAEPADLTTREGLIKHLESLDPAPDPSAAVAPLLASLPASDPAEIMIVTHEDVLADPTFALALRAADPHREWHVATVNRTGQFRLTLLSAAGRRPVCSAQMRLQDVLPPPDTRPGRPPPLPLVDRKKDTSLPAIFHLPQLPLLLPCVADDRRAVATPDMSLISIAADGRLMHWTSNLKGAQQLAPGTPPGKFLGLFADDTDDMILVITHHAPPREAPRITVFVQTLDGTEGITYQHDARLPLAVAYHAGMVLILYNRAALAFDPRTGAWRYRTLPIEYDWRNGRFYRGKNGYYAAAFDGSDIKLHLVTERACIALFDREGLGPWQLIQGGRAVSVIDGPDQGSPPVPLKNKAYINAENTKISPDGHRILTHPVGSDHAFFMNLQTSPQEWTWAHPRADSLLVGGPVRFSTDSGVNPRTRFTRIGITPKTGDLVLYGHGRVAPISLDHKGDLALTSVAANSNTYTQMYRSMHFGPRRAAPGARYRLREARWPDGSRAVLDSRGMLHLQSADGSIPEISLALSTHGVAGWTSDGHTFGWAFFHENPPTVDGAFAYDLLKRFAGRLR